MAKPNLRACKSVGSRTRSKRPAVSNLELSSGTKKNRVQAKIKVSKGDAGVKLESKSEATEKSETKCNAVANSEMSNGTTLLGLMGQSPHESSEIPVAALIDGTESAARGSGSDDCKPVGGKRTTKQKRKSVNGGSNMAARLTPSDNVASASNNTPVEASASKTKSGKVHFVKSTSVDQTSSQLAVDDSTPSHNTPLIRRRNITPSPTLHFDDSPAFPTTWQGLSHNESDGSLTMPSGVININLLPHSCCLHSLHSHRGYSWLSSKTRCGCFLDSNHNTSESLTEAYYGHYSDRYQIQDWTTEKWWLDQLHEGHYELTEDQIAKQLDYMPRQPHLNPNMRAILMDWMVEMSLEYGLHTETVYLSVMLVDRALACVTGGDGGLVVEKDRLQCVGCACTLIASKLLEITPPTVQDFCYISDNSYTVKEILDCEAKICSALKFNLNFTTAYEYVDRFLRASFASNGRVSNVPLKEMVERMVFYFLDLSLLEYKFVGVKPSLVAAAAVYLARATLGIREVTEIDDPCPEVFNPVKVMFGESFLRCSKGFWSKTLEHYTGYDIWDLENSVKMLRRLHENAETNNLKSVYAKFKSEKMGQIALKTVLNEDGLGFF